MASLKLNLISVKNAHQIIANTTSPLGVQEILVKDAAGLVLAENVRAQVSLPPANASAMDGYAISLGPNHKQGSVFKLIGQAPAGEAFQGKLGPGECVRIFTGGAIPDGANHVIIQENVHAKGNLITLSEPVSPAAHIRKAGIDFKRGEVVLHKGTFLDAYGLALLAAANHGRVRVYKRPKIAMIANGDELHPLGQVSGNGVVSSNPYGLAPLIEAWGGEAVFTDICPDDPKIIKTCIETCKGADVLLPIGGASVGDHDYMRGVFDSLGFDKKFAKVAVKPGKPVWFGTLSSQYVLGLPGNPASALVCAHIFLKPLMFALTGNSTPVHKLVAAKLDVDMPANTWRSEYVRATAHISAQGQIIVKPSPRQDSSLITPFVKCNCLLVRDQNTPALKAGETVKIIFTKPL